MGILEIVLILLLIAAIFGRGPLALGVVFDFFIGILVILLLLSLFNIII